VPVLVRTPEGAADDEVVAGTLEIMRFVDGWLDAPGAELTPPEGSEALAAMEALLALHEAFPADDCAMAFGDLITRTHVAPARLRYAVRLMARNDHHVMHPTVREASRAKTAVLLARAAGWQDVDELRRLVRERVHALLDALEEALSGVGSGPFACGAQYSLADVALTVFLAQVHRYSGLTDELIARPNTHRYWLAMQARPSFAQADIWTGARPGKAIEAVVGTVAAPFRLAGGALNDHVFMPIGRSGAYQAVATVTVDMYNHAAVTCREELLPAIQEGAGAAGKAIQDHVFTPVADASIYVANATNEHVLQPAARASVATGRFIVQTAWCVARFGRRSIRMAALRSPCHAHHSDAGAAVVHGVHATGSFIGASWAARGSCTSSSILLSCVLMLCVHPACSRCVCVRARHPQTTRTTTARTRSTSAWRPS
jgi:glutathione S-transferase